MSKNLYSIDFNRFKEIRTIEKGGYGNIYLLEEKKTSKQFAAKVIQTESANIPDSREISIMMAVKHPTIMKMVGFSNNYFNNNNTTILMEYCTNGSLLKKIIDLQSKEKQNTYNDTNRQIILTGIACGMRYLHNLRIIHRDLKPSNILLDENLHPLIADFGLSKFYENGKSHDQSQNAGTVKYMAPELIKGEKYDKKVDVYAFGILMYEVLADSLAFPDFEKGDISPFKFHNKIVNNNYRPDLKKIGCLKNSFKELMEKCWSHDPEERPTFDDIYQNLANFTDKTPDDEESFLLKDVDTNKFKSYLNKIKDKNDLNNNLINQIQAVCKKIFSLF